MTHRIELVLNGVRITAEVDSSELLLDFLRERMRLTGTKEGCGEGECGSCTVLLDGLPVNACLVLACQARGCRVETVESVDPARLVGLHRSGATQCGACTPGVVMSAVWIADNAGARSTHELRELLAGNLCRCTGYDGIVDGVERMLRGEEI